MTHLTHLLTVLNGASVRVPCDLDDMAAVDMAQAEPYDEPPLHAPLRQSVRHPHLSRTDYIAALGDDWRLFGLARATRAQIIDDVVLELGVTRSYARGIVCQARRQASDRKEE